MRRESSIEEQIRIDLLVPANVGIIGYGIVGHALANGFAIASGGKDKILRYDIDEKKANASLREVVELSEFIFITLPTPMKADESGIDLSIIDLNIEKIAPQIAGNEKIVVLKSTVIPGTTRKYAAIYPEVNFVFNPEFLTENRADDDFLEADRTIIGADKNLSLRKVAALYHQRFPLSKIFLTDPTSAEVVKIAANAILAMKVSMANVFDDLCNHMDVKWDEVKSMVASDIRIGPSHLSVTSDRGWGGKCFPKDMVNLLGLCEELNIDARVFKSAWQYNKDTRRIHDWNNIPFAVSG